MDWIGFRKLDPRPTLVRCIIAVPIYGNNGRQRVKTCLVSLVPSLRPSMTLTSECSRRRLDLENNNCHWPIKQHSLLRFAIAIRQTFSTFPVRFIKIINVDKITNPFVKYFINIAIISSVNANANLWSLQLFFVIYFHIICVFKFSFDCYLFCCQFVVFCLFFLFILCRLVTILSTEIVGYMWSFCGWFRNELIWVSVKRMSFQILFGPMVVFTVLREHDASYWLLDFFCLVFLHFNDIFHLTKNKF